MLQRSQCKKPTIKSSIPAGSYLFKLSNGNTRKMCEICPKLIIQKTERHP